LEKGTDVPVVEEINLNGTYSGVEGSVPVKRIVNRSGIIGQVKKVEYLNNAGLVVKSAENVYCFSEDLNTYAGVLDGQMTNKLSEDKPIGLLRERSLRVNTNGVVEKVADYMESKPFFSRKQISATIKCRTEVVLVFLCSHWEFYGF
jgi:hypothetical protein